MVIDLHYPELSGLILVDHQRPDGQVRAHPLVVIDHFPVVHFVNMITCEDDDVSWPLFFKRVDVLVHRIRRALVPLFVDPLLRRNDVDKLIQFPVEILPPRKVDMPREAHCLVLRQNKHFPYSTVEAVAQRIVDDPVIAGKGDCGFCTVPCQRIESLTFATCQNDG